MDNQITLKDIMITDLTVVKLETPFSKIKAIFDTNSFHHLPVVYAMAMVRGIISKQDFIKLTFQLTKETTAKTYSEKIYDHLFAKDIMTKNPVVLNPDDTIGLAADLFLENVYHAIPVMEDGVLIGIVTTHDLLAYAYYQAPISINDTK